MRINKRLINLSGSFGIYNNWNKIMLKKNQLKKKNLQQIAQIFANQTDSGNILLCSQTLVERNQSLTQTRDELLSQIVEQRANLRKIVFQVNDSTKDRLKMKNKLIMHKGSRPSLQEILDISSHYSYMEHQNTLTTRNQQDVKQCLNWSDQKLTDSRKAASQRKDSSYLDEQFQKLQAKCKQQQKIRDTLLQQRDAKRSHYASIAENIDQCRVEYQIVQQKIREAQREMIQLISYFQQRSRQDAIQLQNLREKADNLQRQLLRGQELWNYNSNKKRDLLIMDLESLAIRKK